MPATGDIFGIGIDIVETERIEQSIREFGDRFVERIFTPAEQLYCNKMQRPGPHYAVRFAAKEAVAKAFGTGIGKNLEWTDMEILRNDLGKPHVMLTGQGKKYAEQSGITSVLISLSHSEHYATANALAVRG